MVSVKWQHVHTYIYPASIFVCSKIVIPQICHDDAYKLHDSIGYNNFECVKLLSSSEYTCKLLGVIVKGCRRDTYIKCQYLGKGIFEKGEESFILHNMIIIYIT